MAIGAVEKSSPIKRAIFHWAIRTGRKVRELERRGKEPGPMLKRQYAFADKQVLSKVRGLFGGRIKQCVTGAAPISPDILEFFWACGVPVMEGYGMTETSTGFTINRLEDFKFGSVGKPFRGCEIKIARGRRGPAQGPEHLPRLLQERGGDSRDRRRRLAPHRRPRPGRRRRLPLHHRPQEGHHHHGRAARTSRRPTSRTGSSRTSTSRRPSSTATGARI